MDDGTQSVVGAALLDASDAMSALATAFIIFAAFVAANLLLLLAITLRLVWRRHDDNNVPSRAKREGFVFLAAGLLTISTASAASMFWRFGRDLTPNIWLSFFAATASFICARLGSGRARRLASLGSLFAALCWGAILIFLSPLWTGSRT